MRHQGEKEHFSDYRTASDEVYKLLVQHVNAHALLKGDAEYAVFIDYTNTGIEHFKQEVLK